MRAVDTFHAAPWRHNCAQAVAHRWSRLFGDADVVVKYGAFGGGRAPEGCCGALYAAMTACPERADEIRDRFRARIGATRCRDIKPNGLAPCELCVATADEILEDILK